MRPRIDEVLNSIRWTFDNKIAPALPATDELAQSYARTLSFLLMQLDARLHNENTALHEELHDLSDVLTRVQPLLDVELSKSVDVALLEAQVGKDTINVPYQQVSDLRAVLVKAMKQLPAEQHSEIRGYLSRQIERDGRSLNIPIEANPF